jgi:hypothetical protein
VDYRVRLVTTKPTYGGLRWWFICPLVRRDGGPFRRVAKLYLPPGSRYFGSREGHGLTYTSCRESGKSRGLFRHLAAEMGTDEAMVRAALNRCAKSPPNASSLACLAVGTRNVGNISIKSETEQRLL